MNAKRKHIKRPAAAPRTRINGRETAGRTPGFTIRVPPEQVLRWRDAAARKGMSLSELIRRVMDAAVNSNASAGYPTTDRIHRQG